MGKTSEISVEEAIAQLKASIKDIIHEDVVYGDEFYLLRWLKGANMDVRKAEKSLRKTADWRKEIGLASLVEEKYPENWLESMPIYADAVSKDGRLVATVQAGLVDIRGILEERGRSNVVRLLMQAFGQAELALLDLNRKKFGGRQLTEESIEGGIIILDMDKLSPWHISSFEVIKTVIEVCKNLVKYFPSVGSRVMVINCSKVALTVIKIMRSIMESPSLKFEVYGVDESTWQEAVLSQVDANLLREMFGGTMPKEEKIKRENLINRQQLLSYACAM